MDVCGLIILTTSYLYITLSSILVESPGQLLPLLKREESTKGEGGRERDENERRWGMKRVYKPP